ncbi:MAG: hypothetical protein LBD30_05835 [Verrucomicrobiales bacterium]|nr:hypothetical protein [Verrucomicrobiales bacterium]
MSVTCGLICASVAVIVSGLLPGAAAYLTLMAAGWFGIAVYTGRYSCS